MPALIGTKSAESAPYNRNWGSGLTAPYRYGCVLYNPAAGRLRRRPHLLSQALELVRPLACRIDSCATTGPYTAGPLAAQAIAAGADLILVAGGDGTINEAAQGIAGSDATLGILPAGTADVLAMETGLGHRLLKAAERLPHCHAVRVTTGRLTRPGLPPRLFLAMAGAGLDARIVRQVNPETKRRIGKLSYWGAALGMLGRALPEFDVRIGGKVHRASFALLSRVRNYGGDLEIARHADLLGGRLAVVLFEGPGTLRYLKYFSGVVLNKLEGMRGVRVLETDSAEILDSAAGPVDLQVDGESAGMTPALVDTCPGALRLLVPESFCSRGRAR